MKNKLNRLKEIIKSYESVLIAFSGGVDSTFLLKVALDVLGKEKVQAVTAVSEFFPQHELKDAKEIAQLFGIQLVFLKKSVLKNRNLIMNPCKRCYFCKKELLLDCVRLAKQYDLHVVCDAANVDDLNVYRPGNLAAEEIGIKRPLVASDFRKKDIRKVSRKFKLFTWNKPSYSCLATRFPYGEKLTQQKLSLIDKGEEILRICGFHIVRLRYINPEHVRIVVGEKEIYKFSNKHIRQQCIKKLKDLGFNYITLDLEGYQSGRLDKEMAV